MSPNARTQQAASDNNANAKALITPGEQEGKACYKLCFSKANKRWVVKPINKKKSYQFLSDLLSQVISRVEQGNAVPLQPHVQLLRNIASKQAPTKAEATQQHHSRFNR